MTKENNFLNKYVIIRADRAGIFAGILKERVNNEVVLTEARRIWYWDGANSISQLAITGPMKPTTCKFTAPLDRILVLGVIEVIPCTKDSEKIIRGVPVWSKN